MAKRLDHKGDFDQANDSVLKPEDRLITPIHKLKFAHQPGEERRDIALFFGKRFDLNHANRSMERLTRWQSHRAKASCPDTRMQFEESVNEFAHRYKNARSLGGRAVVPLRRCV